MNPAGKRTDPIDVVILLHGIRTHAFWYEIATPILEAAGKVHVKPLGYGYFNVFRFLFPRLFQRGPATEIAKKIQAIQWDYTRKNIDIRVSIIAHSFGTHTIKTILETEDHIDLYNLVLCGSVLPENYDFGKIARKVSNRIVNDAGAKDVWPVIARIASFGYGDSGTFGFRSGLCKDRFHDFAHSDFFTPDFIERFWKPLFADDSVVGSTFRHADKKQSWVVSLLSTLPKATLPLAFAAMLAGGTFVYRAPIAASLCGSKLHAFCPPPPPAVSNLKAGGAVLVTHFVGEPVVGFSVSFINPTDRAIVANNFQLDLTSPDGKRTGLSFAGLSVTETMGAVPLLVPALQQPASQNTDYYMWWARQPLTQLNLGLTYQVKQLPEYATKTPCQLPEPLSDGAEKLVRASFASHFIWSPGTWTLRLKSDLEGKPLEQKWTMNLSETDVELMRKVETRYKSCFALGLANFKFDDGDAKTYIYKSME